MTRGLPDTHKRWLHIPTGRTVVILERKPRLISIMDPYGFRKWVPRDHLMDPETRERASSILTGEA